MTQCQVGEKSLPEPIMTQFYEVQTQHQAPMNQLTKGTVMVHFEDQVSIVRIIS